MYDRQESDHEPGGIRGQGGDGAASQALRPSRRRRGADHAVNVVVILAGDLEVEPFIQLSEGELRIVLRLVTAPRRWRGVCATREQMYFPHKSADQPLDVRPNRGLATGRYVKAIPYSAQPRVSASPWNSDPLSTRIVLGMPNISQVASVAGVAADGLSAAPHVRCKGPPRGRKELQVPDETRARFGLPRRWQATTRVGQWRPGALSRRSSRRRACDRFGST